MSTLTLNKPIRKQQRVVLNVVSRKYDFLMELLKNFDFVEVATEEADGESREEIIAKLKGAAEDLKLIKEGKLKGRPLKDFLNEIKKKNYA
jgi:hypothetical protein